MSNNKMDSTIINIIIKMLKDKMSYDDINRLTGYTVEDIRDIQKKYLSESYLILEQSKEGIIGVLKSKNDGEPVSKQLEDLER